MTSIPRRYGCRRDTRDPRDHEFKLRATRFLPLPPAMDHRKYMPPIQSQGDLGSCVLNVLTSALRWHVNLSGGPDAALSRLQAYYFTREIENTIESDAGCEIRNAVKAVKRVGVAKEVFWPYDESKFRVRPPDEVVRVGKLWSALSYERVAVNTRSIKEALTIGPVMFGVTLFSSFESEDVERTGVVPMPDVEKEGVVGGHAMLLVGYGQKPGYFTVANSWGPEWGDKGYCYIPERYVASTEFGGDYWIVKNLGGA